MANLIAFVIVKYEQTHKKETTMNPAVYAVVAVIAILFVLPAVTFIMPPSAAVDAAAGADTAPPAAKGK